VSVGGSFPLLYSLCGDLCSAEQRGIISAAMGVATSVGVATGQLLAGFLGPRLGWRVPFVAVAYPAIFFAILLWATVPDPRKRQSTEDGVELARRSPKANAGSASSTEAYTAEVELQAEMPVSEVYERNPERNASQGHGNSAEMKRANTSESDLAMDPHAAVTDCSRFGLVWRGRSNRIFLCQAVPGCIAWSTVTTFIPDYLHKEQGLSVESATLLVSFFGASCLVWALGGAALGQRIYNRNKGHLAYLMSCCTAFAVCPFLLLINSSPDSLQTLPEDGQGVVLPSAWALFVAFLGGAAAVTNPNLKGLLMNVNTSATRGTVFALVTLTDDVGKGLGPEVVALGVSALGRRLALSMAMACWFLCSLLLYFSRWTIVKDVLRVERLEKLPAAAV
ncbi:SV2A, partial [Symbiodinium microadriaticum]